MAKKDFGGQRNAIISATPIPFAGDALLPEQRADCRRPRILIVDDNRDGADSLQILLESLGYEAQVAYEGYTALRMLDAIAFSVILLDLAMPGIDGFELARRIRASSAASPPIIAVTGWADHKTHTLTQDAGMLCRLVKPIEIDELRRWIDLVTQRTPAGATSATSA
jgi:DNA-binding response OmpR family regulator